MGGFPHDAVVDVLDCDIVGSEFKLQLHYYIHCWTNSLKEGMKPLFSFLLEVK